MTTFAGALVLAGIVRSSSVSATRPSATSYGTTVNSGSFCANAGAANASAAAHVASRPPNIRFKETPACRKRARPRAGAGRARGYLRFADPLGLDYRGPEGGFDVLSRITILCAVLG